MAEHPRPPVQVFAYDDAAGREEGTELEALLAYFPASAPESAKVRALSLARGIVGFVSQFDDDGTGGGRRDSNDVREDARVVRTKRGRLACLLAEEEEETRPTGTTAGRSPAHASPRRLWLCVSVDESIASVAAVRDGALVDLLRILRDDYAMLRGGHPPRGQPREGGAPDDASGGCDDRRSARLLAVLVADLGARVSPAAAGWEGATLAPDARMCGDALRVLHSPLSPEGLGLGCPLTPTSREAFLLTQSAVNAAQLSLEDWADVHRRDADVDADMNADMDAADGRDENDEWDLVADTAVFHEGGLLWSSSTAIASRAVSRYAARCLVPSAAFREEGGADMDADVDADVDAGEKAEKASEKAGRARALAAAVRAEAAAGAASLKRGESPGGESPRGEGDLIGGSSFDDVPIAASEWSVAPDGFLRRSAAAGEAVEASGRDVPAAAHVLRLGPPAARTWGESVRGSHGESPGIQEGVYLLSLRVGACTLAVSLRVARCPPLTDEASWRDLRGCVRNASAPRLRELHDCLATQTHDSKAAAGRRRPPPDHAPGYRYLYVDAAALAVRATPRDVPGATTVHVRPDVLATVQSVRREMEALESESTTDGGDASSPADVCRTHELCVRSGADAWVVGKRATAGAGGGTGKRTNRDVWLWVVLDRAGDTLLDASAAINAFCDEHFDGIFS
ncbi:predicted protein [Micromonas commoda]|uniref:CCZ1/INTU/HSP4 first Longin domain-containing protein n=1 Tax=Micromonas commoda (strain RCC299 / NOUM17 / CCMP2709) TaxID=296587 RepID=C1DZA4_MICCC|nr:predicted protein [Micromonas commoda]ACO61572.1 predicted protein [Micromonas commoda]|eukprot:XP_002500314.1 predicted protein [Micromonas commoda]